MRLFQVLKAGENRMIGDFCDVTDGIHTSIDYDEESCVNLISATSPRENYFDLSRNAKISEKAHKDNPRTALRLHDVVLSTVGTIGNCAVVDQSVLPANSDRHVGIIRVKKEYSPYVVSAYLLSKYGRMQTFRETTGNVQPNLFLYKIREILIPKFDTALQKQVEEISIEARKKRNISEQKYKEAESFLLQKLGVEGWKPEETKVSVRTYRDVFAAERMDAEYYQQKYDDIREKLKSFVYLPFREVCGLYDGNFSPEKNTMYRYIELSNIGSMGEINGCTMGYGSDLPNRARRIVHKGNIILSSIEGSLQSCALVTKEYDQALCSNGFYVIDSERINSETLLVLMKSWPVQAMLKRGCSGTILTGFDKSVLEELPVPIPPDDVQKQTAKLVEESIRLREESRSLFEQAKTMVERAVEGRGV